MKLLGISLNDWWLILCCFVIGISFLYLTVHAFFDDNLSRQDFARFLIIAILVGSYLTGKITYLEKKNSCQMVTCSTTIKV